jgi:hypothetical protein
MVLALSSNKINYQFQKMYQRNIIHKDWAFLTNSMGRDIKTLTNEEAKSYWTNIDTNKSNLEAKKAELEFIDKDMTAAIIAKNWDNVAELNSKKESVQAEVNALQLEVDKANLYDLGLIATIAEPKIEILSETSKELIFQISFKPGSTLFYTREGKKAEYDLGGNEIKYAFRVSIGKIKITSDRKIVEIDENGQEQEKILRDKGINDNDFTIQALFLDFENANIANYDSKSSTLPEGASDNALLQAAMVNYFKSLANSDNPYVLGYGIHKNEVQEGERGLFYPTGVAYSTSHSREQRASTFNFLMLLNNHSFPSGNDSGVLPVSLMEHAQDTTATVNGVFGLNISEFENNYIPLLSNSLNEKMITKTAEIEGFNLKSSGFDEDKKNFYIDYSSGDLSGKININYKGVQESSNQNSVDVVYEITSQATVHQELPGPLHIGTIGVDWFLSTSGDQTPDGMKDNKVPRGQIGSLIIQLKVGASGKLELGANYAQQMILGFDSKEPTYRKESDKDWMTVFNIVKWISPIIGLIDTIMDSVTGFMNPLGEIKDFGSILNIQNLENLENKIILPVASVYTYKNVRLSGNSSDQNAVLLFDTSYGTVAQ